MSNVIVVINRHGIRQLRTAWADGPAYITQCPIKGGSSYTYNFTVVNQRGTLLWHAHYSWQRASIYGAFIIYPRMPYPFSASIHAQVPIIFGNLLSVFSHCSNLIGLIFYILGYNFVWLVLPTGEWWNIDVNIMASEMMMYGSGPNFSDAYTINGFPGPLYPCSSKGN